MFSAFPWRCDPEYCSLMRQFSPDLRSDNASLSELHFFFDNELHFFFDNAPLSEVHNFVVRSQIGGELVHKVRS